MYQTQFCRSFSVEGDSVKATVVVMSGPLLVERQVTVTAEEMRKLTGGHTFEDREKILVVEGHPLYAEFREALARVDEVVDRIRAHEEC